MRLQSPILSSTHPSNPSPCAIGLVSFIIQSIRHLSHSLSRACAPFPTHAHQCLVLDTYRKNSHLQKQAVTQQEVALQQKVRVQAMAQLEECRCTTCCLCLLCRWCSAVVQSPLSCCQAAVPLSRQESAAEEESVEEDFASIEQLQQLGVNMGEHTAVLSRPASQLLTPQSCKGCFAASCAYHAELSSVCYLPALLC